MSDATCTTEYLEDVALDYGVGYDLLCKAGFKKGETLSYSPISLTVNGKRGLGYKRQGDDINEYRNHLKNLKQLNTISRDLRNAIGICEHYNASGPWNECNDESTQLNMVIEHLLKNYNYCLWCGIEYESADDLLNNCPGSRENH